MRIALEVVAILERSRLAFVDVDRHQPRRRLGANDLPFAPGGKTGATQAPQAGLVSAAITASTVRSPPKQAARFVAAIGAVRREVDIRLAAPARPVLRRSLRRFFGGRMVDRIASDQRRRRVLAAPDARRADDANAGASGREAPPAAHRRPPSGTKASRRRERSAGRRRLAVRRRRRSDGRRSRPRRPRSARVSSPRPARRHARRRCGHSESWIRCRNSIKRSRRRGASPSRARISASACGSTWRPFGWARAAACAQA